MAPRAIMILGPTASGKTALSLSLAKRVPVEIISVDSALVYRGLDIGSAKPTQKEREICPHHLIDVREISEPYSAADFRIDALRLIDEIRARGRFPLLVGGTMLYAKALREGIDDLPQTDETVRVAVLKEAETLGWPKMHEILASFDPQMAARLHPTDAQRIARAHEVYRMSARPMSEFLKGEKTVDESIYTIGLVPADRARLHAMIAKRFDAMVKKGLLEEVRSLMKRNDFDRELPSMRAVGYRQMIEHLAGETSLAEAIEKGKAATRQLAKRQMTWLRSMDSVEIVDPYADGFPDCLVDRLSFLCADTKA